jgi:ABC-2 type transport system ATP-binding protein
MNDDCLAELAGVSKRFGKTAALDGLDLKVQRGQLVAVLGPNGAGKTTAISLLLGVHQPDTGSARLFGQSPLRIEARRQIGVMMQEVGLAPELRVREHIELVASYYPAPLTPAEAMEKTHTQSLATAPMGSFRMVRSGRRSLPWLCVVVQNYSSWMSLRWGWISRPGKQCGRRCANS